MRFSRELDQLAGHEQLVLELGFLPLQLLELAIALVTHRLASRCLRDEARCAVGPHLLAPLGQV